MLKTINKKIELITDPDMYFLVEEGIRGGFCNVSKRLIEANNRYMGSDFEPSKPESYILYLDANNLYLRLLFISQYLPIGDYAWLNNNELFHITNQITRIPDENPKGYILEVDLEIPKHLHSKFSDFTLCPERLSTTENSTIPKKLIASLHPKKKYVVHFSYLKTV
jgi:hypothetical protein